MSARQDHSAVSRQRRLATQDRSVSKCGRDKTARVDLGLPLSWRAETSGVLTAAVQAYYGELLGEAKMSDEQLLYVRAHLVHYINAPCWLERHPSADLNYALLIEALRKRAVKLSTVPEIAHYLNELSELGMNPL